MLNVFRILRARRKARMRRACASSPILLADLRALSMVAGVPSRVSPSGGEQGCADRRDGRRCADRLLPRADQSQHRALRIEALDSPTAARDLVGAIDDLTAAGLHLGD